MSEFGIYFTLGFKHIVDFNGYDHILFIVALCAPYMLKSWKQILILVTAFTIGHSATLAAATFGFVLLPIDVIEFLIPVTIILTCVFNIIRKSKKQNKQDLHYILALFFGFIHGLGFSNYLRMLLGKEESIVIPLLAFNTGLEAGQILIVSIVLGITFLVVNSFKVVHKKWNLSISSIAAVIAIFLLAETKFW